MEENTAIKISGLSKKYFLSEQRTGLSFSGRLKTLFSTKNIDKQNCNDEFYALKDINLTVKKGEALGIIGRNGAGKSTLLKILSEVVEPTEGTIEIHGTVASVLEIGMGFHPDLSGRENVFLSGAMLGIPRKKIAEVFDTILEFSGIGNFIDTPVKHYSSGMFLRLAFSVVAHLDTDIMLFDETLSTGDIAFQLRCYERIDELINQGKTILLVSHNLNDIARISTRIIYLEKGMLKSDSQSKSLNIYLRDALTSNALFEKPAPKTEAENIDQREVAFSTGEYTAIHEDIQIKKIGICAVNKSAEEEICTDDELELYVEYYKRKDEDFFDIGFTFSYLNSMIIYVHALNSDLDIRNQTERGNYIAKLRIPPCFFNDVTLQIGVSISKNYREVIFAYKKFLNVKLVKEKNGGEELSTENGYLPRFIGPVFPKWNWNIIKINQ